MFSLIWCQMGRRVISCYVFAIRPSGGLEQWMWALIQFNQAASLTRRPQHVPWPLPHNKINKVNEVCVFNPLYKCAWEKIDVMSWCGIVLSAEKSGDTMTFCEIQWRSCGLGFNATLSCIKLQILHQLLMCETACWRAWTYMPMWTFQHNNALWWKPEALKCSVFQKTSIHIPVTSSSLSKSSLRRWPMPHSSSLWWAFSCLDSWYRVQWC